MGGGCESENTKDRKVDAALLDTAKDRTGVLGGISKGADLLDSNICSVKVDEATPNYFPAT